MSVPQAWTPPTSDAFDQPVSPEQVIAGLKATDEGGADLVQLLTPEGERVDNPRFDGYVADVDVPALQRPVPGHGAGPPVRPGGQRAAAAGPARHLGAAARPGGRADRRRPRAAPQDMAFPSYREHGVAWCRGIDPTELLGIFRGTDQGSWDPKATRFHSYTIVIGNQVPQRHRLRDGPAVRGAKVGRRTPDARGHHRASSATAPPARATCTRAWSSPPSTTRRSSSTARTTSGRSPSRPSGSPGCRCTSGRTRLRLPRHPGRRQRRARLPGRHPLGAGGVPHRQRPGADRGVHLPDGRAHHLRRPDPLPAGRRGGALEAARTRSSGSGCTWSASTASSRSSSTRSQAEADELAARFRAVLRRHAHAGAGPDVLPGLRGGLAASCDAAARGLPGLPRRRSRGR